MSVWLRKTHLPNLIFAKWKIALLHPQGPDLKSGPQPEQRPCSSPVMTANLTFFCPNNQLAACVIFRHPPSRCPSHLTCVSRPVTPINVYTKKTKWKKRIEVYLGPENNFLPPASLIERTFSPLSSVIPNSITTPPPRPSVLTLFGPGISVCVFVGDCEIQRGSSRAKTANDRKEKRGEVVISLAC